MRSPSTRQRYRCSCALVLSLTCACVEGGAPADNPATPSTLGNAASPGVAKAHAAEQGSSGAPEAKPPEFTAQADTTDSAQWPPGGKKCRLLHCANRVFFVGEAPGGWQGNVEVGICIRERCESHVVDLRRVKREGAALIGGLLFEVFAVSNHCPHVMQDLCEGSGLARRLRQQRPGQALLVLAIDALSAGRQAVPIDVKLSKEGRTQSLGNASIGFDDAICRRPNGSRCEPECCETIREF